MFAYLAEAVREIDRVTIEERGVPGLTLMKRAATASVTELLERWPAPGKIAVLCGSGNNAGDGYIVAGMLADRGHDVSVCRVGREPAPGSDAAQALAFCSRSPARLESLGKAVEGAAVIVDALLGTGTAGDIRPAFEEAIEAANSAGARILAVDLPSGLDADTGQVRGPCVKADVTVTFIALKLGLMTGDGPEVAGDVVLADLGVDTDSIAAVRPALEIMEFESLRNRLPRRHRNAHKMRHGHLLVVGSNRGMPGAAAMAAEAALYSGAGMVTAATHPDCVSVVVGRRPEVMARGVMTAEELSPLLDRCHAAVIGPGLGRDEWATTMFRCVLASGLPLIVDADGLNLLAETRESRNDWVLTPHPGEAGRLLGGRNIQEDRLAAVKLLQEAYGGSVLLKGAGTLICDGTVSLCPYGNPGMSVAGMGDILSGVIGGLLVQGLSREYATRLGAAAHSLAADRLVSQQGERGLLATELLPGIRSLLNQPA